MTNPPPVNRRIAYPIAVASFGAKGVFAFAITYLVANNLPKEDFGLWVTMFSIATMLGVSELGVGQLILTTFHEKELGREEAARIVANSVAAMVVLSLGLEVILALAIWWGHLLSGIRWGWLLFGIILLRLVAAPYAAYISALERYHERRLVEAISYAASAAFVAWGITAGADLSGLLLGMNLILTLGSLAIVLRAGRLGMPRVRPAAVSRPVIGRVFKESFPYFVSNVSSLTTYAGFIPLSALILNPLELARLSLLHNLLLMHAMQIFDLLFKQVQPRMRDPSLMRGLTRWVGISYGVSLTGAVLVGTWIIGHIFHKYQFTPIELGVYTTFVFLEVYFLMITSAMQMRSALKHSLQFLSILKAVAFGAVLVLALLLPRPLTILPYAMLLTLYSAAMGLICRKVSRASQPAET